MIFSSGGMDVEFIPYFFMTNDRILYCPAWATVLSGIFPYPVLTDKCQESYTNIGHLEDVNDY